MVKIVRAHARQLVRVRVQVRLHVHVYVHGLQLLVYAYLCACKYAMMLPMANSRSPASVFYWFFLCFQLSLTYCQGYRDHSQARVLGVSPSYPSLFYFSQNKDWLNLFLNELGTRWALWPFIFILKTSIVSSYSSSSGRTTTCSVALSSRHLICLHLNSLCILGLHKLRRPTCTKTTKGQG